MCVHLNVGMITEAWDDRVKSMMVSRQSHLKDVTNKETAGSSTDSEGLSHMNRHETHTRPCSFLYHDAAAAVKECTSRMRVHGHCKVSRT